MAVDSEFLNDDISAAIKLLKTRFLEQDNVAPTALLVLANELISINKKRIKNLVKQTKKTMDQDKLSSCEIRKSRPVSDHSGSMGKKAINEPPRNLNTVTDLEKYVQALDFSSEKQDDELFFSRTCHICRTKYSLVHFFYDQLCPQCSELNFMKRNSSVNLDGRIALVTGSRVKIGFRISLKLLRMGATVIATSRFPHDAALRFAKEADFEAFASRLFIYGIDFRDMMMVHEFAQEIMLKFNHLDIILNNAAQTVRKPTMFYQHLMDGEMDLLPSNITALTNVVDVFKTETGFLFKKWGRGALGLPAKQAMLSLAAVNHSAGLSQVSLIKDDEEADPILFPSGLYDRDQQQLDLRAKNSWVLELGEISTTEMIECHVINSFAPFVLISELKPLMMKSPNADRYIINVSAMEGQFYRTKTIFHPHTNMSKAALNMLTRTSAAGFATDKIYMTNVDTGWITDENPVDQHVKRELTPPPLDEEDAAMRCLDPVILGIHIHPTPYEWCIILKFCFPNYYFRDDSDPKAWRQDSKKLDFLELEKLKILSQYTHKFIERVSIIQKSASVRIDVYSFPFNSWKKSHE